MQRQRADYLKIFRNDTVNMLTTNLFGGSLHFSIETPALIIVTTCITVLQKLLHHGFAFEKDFGNISEQAGSIAIARCQRGNHKGYDCKNLMLRFICCVDFILLV